ncbi:MAG: FkbM family methyltransferase [Pseudomonadota bacterium]
MRGVVAETVHRLQADPEFAGVHASLATYYGDGDRDAKMDRLYRRFVPDGGLAFDVGAHVGDRTACFRRCGARVVAVEPQPICAQTMEALFGADLDVTLVAEGCADKSGSVVFHLNNKNPTVSTASSAFIAHAAGADGWVEQVWDQTITVRTTTLDALIKAHGQPDFIKIDVEGFEDVVLNGLSAAPPALSFEFTTIQRDCAFAALARLKAIGQFRCNLALGESQQLLFDAEREVSIDEMADVIKNLPHAANSGDVYAVRI